MEGMEAPSFQTRPCPWTGSMPQTGTVSLFSHPCQSADPWLHFHARCSYKKSSLQTARCKLATSAGWCGFECQTSSREEVDTKKNMSSSLPYSVGLIQMTFFFFLHFLSHLSVMSETVILACLSTPSLTAGNPAAGRGSDGRCTLICYMCYSANTAM